MEISEVLSLIASRGIDIVIDLLKQEKVRREDIEIVLLITIAKEIQKFRQEFDEFRREFTDFRNEFGESRKQFNDFRSEFRMFRDEFSDFKKVFESFRSEFESYRGESLRILKDINDRLDVISNQLRVLNTNISSTYELVSKIMAKLMELSLTR